jgi:hypothetical protein
VRVQSFGTPGTYFHTGFVLSIRSCASTHLTLTGLRWKFHNPLTASVELLLKKIRVLVANQPRLMRDMVLTTLGNQPDIDIVGEIEDDSKIACTVAELHPDFVIVGLDRPNQRPAVCDQLLAHDPSIKVLAVAIHHDETILFWSAIQSMAIESSERGILNVLRGRAALSSVRVM